MDVEAEIVELKRRISTLETEVRSDHDFSVRLFGYVREMRDDIAVLRSDIALVRTHAVVTDKRIGQLEERIERVEADIAGLRSDLTALRSEFESFRKELPAMISDTMREVLRDFRR